MYSTIYITIWYWHIQDLEVCAFGGNYDKVKHVCCLIYLARRISFVACSHHFVKSISEKENYQKNSAFWIKKKIMKVLHNFLQCKRVLKIFVLSSLNITKFVEILLWIITTWAISQCWNKKHWSCHICKE